MKSTGKTVMRNYIANFNPPQIGFLGMHHPVSHFTTSSCFLLNQIDYYRNSTPPFTLEPTPKETEVTRRFSLASTVSSVSTPRTKGTKTPCGSTWGQGQGQKMFDP